MKATEHPTLTEDPTLTDPKNPRAWLLNTERVQELLLCAYERSEDTREVEDIQREFHAVAVALDRLHACQTRRMESFV